MNRASRVRLAAWGVLAASALVLLVRAEAVPLLDPDESRFARTSVEMLRDGDLVVPRFGGEPRLVKPPLVHWIQSFLFRWLGATEWAARLHGALSTLGSILLAGWLARRRFGDEGGVWAMAVLASTPLVLVPGRIGTLDALLALHVFAVVALDMVPPEETGSYRGLAIGGLLGLAFLAKGPVGVLLPLLIILAGRTATGRELLPSPAGAGQALAAWCVVVLPWGLAFLSRVGAGTVAATLRAESLERYFAGNVHVEPPWFYAKVLAVGALPWIAPLVLAIGRTWGLRKLPVARTAVYAAAGLLAGLVFFSISRTKLPSYILPLAPMIAILVTWELGREIEAPRERTAGPILLAATLAVCSILFGSAAATVLTGEARTVSIAGSAIYGAGALIAGLSAARRRPRGVYAAAATSTLAFFLIVVTVLLPAVAANRSAAGLIEAVPDLASRRPLVTVEVNVPSLVFYLDRVPEVIEVGDLEDRLEVRDDPLFVFVDVDLPAMPTGAMARLREIGRHAKYRVYEKQPSPAPA